MAKTKAEKRKAREKVKKLNHRKTQHTENQNLKSEFYYDEARWLISSKNFEKALIYLQKAIKLSPSNEYYFRDLIIIGQETGRKDVLLTGLDKLHRMGKLDNDDLPLYINTLIAEKRFQDALDISDMMFARLPEMKKPNRSRIKTQLKDVQQYCRFELETIKATPVQPIKHPVKKQDNPEPVLEKQSLPSPSKPKEPDLPDIPATLTIDTLSFTKSLAENGNAATIGLYDLVMEGHRIRFMDSFENLICLPSLKGIQSFWYQEETARKVLKTFRGRALLSDEVGLGKTIEAGIVLKEYIQRGMVKTALVLTPNPLVSQWREELSVKFGLDFPSTDDPEYKNSDDFWDSPFILASINQAKSTKNFSRVTDREYDLVIVDEAHHLKNRSTLNWKLVNALKKRFLLLLTATPVENNLMELYNLITLLKPGQLKTSAEFRREFMTKGDPTSPQNKRILRELLSQVMIRNTRALAKIDIPPRFAQTLRVEPDPNENELYERVIQLVGNINRTNGSGNRLLLKNLLAEAGSSPRALEVTLARVLAGKDLPADSRNDIRSILNLCRTIMGETGKNRTLLKLIKKQKGKIIIFVKYIGSLEQLSEFLSWNDIPHALFHGSMDNSAKDEQIRIFQEERDILVTTEIGGEGRNLQFCCQMVNYDLPWNPMKIEQRIGRIHRIGQDKQVMIYNLCNAGSIEDHILEILDRKINMFEMVIGEVDMIIGRIREEAEFEDIIYDIWVNATSEAEREKGFADLGVRLQRSKSQHEKTRELDKDLFGENYEL
ncbi:SNF2-related protein [Desulfobacterium sp. N47]|uniref:SNF2-related protein n=1 Tax=Desulfobacterium sp. N47 TaxID=3115210 RepID=UPI003F4A14D4